MKLYKILICIAVFSFSCEGVNNAPKPNKLVETKNDDKIIVSGDYIFYNNAGVLQTSKDVLNKLPMEFAVEAQKLLEISLEGSVG